MEQARYLISDAAKKVEVESHVLRYWEEELEIPIKRNELGHRYYTQDDVECFREIKSLKEQGLQLKAIRMILKDGKLERWDDKIVSPARKLAAEQAAEAANMDGSGSGKKEGSRTGNGAAIYESSQTENGAAAYESGRTGNGTDGYKDGRSGGGLERCEESRTEGGLAGYESSQTESGADRYEGRGTGNGLDNYGSSQAGSGVNGDKGRGTGGDVDGDKASGTVSGPEGYESRRTVSGVDSYEGGWTASRADGYENNEVVGRLDGYENSGASARQEKDGTRTSGKRAGRYEAGGMAEDAVNRGNMAADGHIVSEQERHMIEIIKKREIAEVREESREEKNARMQFLLQNMIAEAVRDNNRELCEDIKQSVLKELDYQFRMQEERTQGWEEQRRRREEEHYKALDEMLRSYSSKKGKKRVKSDKKKSAPFGLKKKPSII